jgi:hypothetical protein
VHRTPFDHDGELQPEQLVAMNGLLDEMTMAGALLAVERCRSSALGARVRNIAGDITVKEGALAPALETISGVYLVRVNVKAEAIEWSRRLLAVLGEGEMELLQLNDVYRR